MFARRSRPQPGKQPGDITVADLERFGRHSYDYRANPWPESWADLVGPVYDRYHDDQDAFLALLADLADQYRGTWAAYGAEKLMTEIAGGGLDHPAYGRIMDASLEFLRRSGVSPRQLNGYEWNYWIDSGGTVNTWLTRRPEPTEDRIERLAIGEIRRLAQLLEDDDSNVFLVKRTAEDRYDWVIDSRQSDEDPTRTQRVHDTADSLHELYIKIGLGLQFVPYWCDSELEPYCPLPRPPF
jgi:hypothetical protein